MRASADEGSDVDGLGERSNVLFFKRADLRDREAASHGHVAQGNSLRFARRAEHGAEPLGSGCGR